MSFLFLFSARLICRLHSDKKAPRFTDDHAVMYNLSWLSLSFDQALSIVQTARICALDSRSIFRKSYRFVNQLVNVLPKGCLLRSRNVPAGLGHLEDESE